MINLRKPDSFLFRKHSLHLIGSKKLFSHNFNSNKSLAVFLITFLILGAFIGLVQIPQAKATSTLGDTNIEAPQNIYGATTAIVTDAFIASSNENLTSLSIYFQTDTTIQGIGLIYSSTNVLLGQTVTPILMPNTAQWVTFSGLNVAVVAGSTYYLGISLSIPDTGGWNIYTNSGSSGQLAYLFSSTFPTAPSPITYAGYQDKIMSIYASYAATSAFMTNCTIRVNGAYYEGWNETNNVNTLLYGGSGNVGGINGSSLSAVASAASGNLSKWGTLTFASGNFVSDDGITLQDNTYAVGQGTSTFIQSAPNRPHATGVFNGATNVSISNMWLDGNRTVQNQTGDQMLMGIWASGVNETFTNLKLTNFQQCGIDVPYAHNILIQNCWGNNSKDGDVWIDINSYNVTVQNSELSNLFVVDFGGSMHDVVLRGNTITAISGQWYGIEIYGGTGYPYNVEIQNNTVIGATQEGIHVEGGNNNTMENNFVNSLNYSSTVGVGLIGTNATVVRNNIVVNNGWFGVQNPSPTFGGTYNQIYFNDLRGNGLGAIQDNKATSFDIVTDNIPDNLTSSVISNSISQSGNIISELWSNGQTVGLLLGITSSPTPSPSPTPSATPMGQTPSPTPNAFISGLADNFYGVMSLFVICLIIFAGSAVIAVVMMVKSGRIEGEQVIMPIVAITVTSMVIIIAVVVVSLLMNALA